ncbi:GDSL-type esterase/lipase family protein [Polyangium mundeleinium]|uniref:GDSL-type esterase/lipase family protein n=1 Tax=Polyangium mundeleinium TaxID=2995306 RepID=A0ABT5EZZ3_9BACT|nr:GDSL-type esterase/lipase family protein [Polyangium mundeleinium]MDC0747411.1 GDSL-type esterase/lipase family protein [Polyangium mundeleinium]
MTLSNSLFALTLAFLSCASMGCTVDSMDAAMADDAAFAEGEDAAEADGEDEEVAEAESELGVECKIQPFGDSLTAGIGGLDGYRGHLLVTPPAVGAPIRMSGLSGDWSSPNLWAAGQHLHSGYPGFRIDQLTPWIQTNYVGANVLLVHAGTNDILQGQGHLNAAYDLDIMVRWLIAFNPTARILVAKIIPLMGAYAVLNGEVTAYNAYVDGIVATLKAQGYGKVDVVDMNTGFPTWTLAADGIHPDATGYAWMASRWRNKLNALGCF